MASNRDLNVRIDADASAFNRGVKSAEASAKVFERELKKVDAANAKHAQSVAHVARLREKFQRDEALRSREQARDLAHVAQLRAKSERDEQARVQRQQQHLTQIGLAASVAGVAVAAGLGKAVSASMGFEKSLSGLRAATGANVQAMDRLRESALQVGKDTSFSATEAVEAQTALAKAGIATADILGGALAGAASLAAAGQMDMGAAAEVAATAMTQFKLAGADVPHIADLLAAGAGKAQGDVSDLAMALNQAGLVASQTGLTIEETTGGLSAFASAGLLGSDAGTSFKTMLQRLNPTSDEAAGLMDELGLRAYDAQGNFVGLSEYAGQLQTALGGMSAEQRNAAMNTLFGSDAVRAAAVLYEQGSAGVEKWEAAVADSGYASRTAAAMTDNLVGDLERLGGSIETALIENGTAANGVLRALVQTADGAVGVFSSLPGPVQGVATGVAGLTGAVSLASGAFLLGAPKVAAFKDALGDMGPRSQRFGGAILRAGSVLTGPWGLALGAGVVALGLFAKAKADAQAEVDAFTAAIERDSGVVGANARAHAAASLESKGLLRTAEELSLSLEDVTSAAVGDERAMRDLRRVVDGYSEAATDATRAAQAKGLSLDEGSVAAHNMASEAEGLLGKVEDLAGSTEAGIAAARRNAEAIGDSGEAAAGAAPQVDALGNAMVGGAEKTEEMSDAQKDLQQALESWTSPLATYQELVQSTAQRTADATEDAGDSWEDYKDRGLKSLDQFSVKLEEQNTAHQQWRDNLVEIAKKVGPDVAGYIAEMGEDGVMLAAQFANGTAEETARAAAAIRQNMSQGTAEAATSLDQGMKVLAAIAKSGGKATAHQLAAELQVGVDQVARIAEQYGVKLKAGVDPILLALGRPGILAGTSGRARNQVQRYAKGGIARPSDYALATGGLVDVDLPLLNVAAVAAA